MAITDAYASPEEFKAMHPTSVQDNALSSHLVAVSRYLDHKLGRPSGFGKDASATVRYYVPRASNTRAAPDWAEAENPWKAGGLVRIIDVEDIVSVTSIAIDKDRDNTFSQTLTATDYDLLPRNASVGPEPRPYNQIAASEWGSLLSWPAGCRVKVTAVHGWPSVPPAIKWATITIAAMVQGDSFFTTDRISELDTTVSASPQVRSILNGLMSSYSRGVFF